eukprot:2969168-Amphidinium_carterae.1
MVRPLLASFPKLPSYRKVSPNLINTTPSTKTWKYFDHNGWSQTIALGVEWATLCTEALSPEA